MQVIKHPKQAQLAAILARTQAEGNTVDDAVKAILATVKKGGDKAVKNYT